MSRAPARPRGKGGAGAPRPAQDAKAPQVLSSVLAQNVTEAAPAPAGRRIHALAAAALMAVYLAVMSGHMTSMDGFLIQRQAQALVFEQSVNFRTPGWFWMGESIYSSKFGIGMSLAYVPGMLLASPLAASVPRSQQRPKKTFTFYYQQLYQNPLYTVGASWVHAAITAFAAYLVGRLISALGCSRRASLWGMAFYGIGSAALVYSRGDFSQPLVGLCWVAALLGAVRFRASDSPAAVWTSAAAVGYAILTRPLDGMLLFFAVLALVVPLSRSQWSLRALRPAFVIVLGVAVAVGLTGLVNLARTGDAMTSGYRLENAWKIPELARLAYVLVGPARGILWEFPAVLLVPFGVAALVRKGRRLEVIVMLSLCGALLLNTAAWKVWWGGWCWGLRLFLPAIPVLAVVAGAGVDRLGPQARRWLPALLLLAGFVWTLPGVITDPLEGFARLTDAAPLAWTLAAFPPYGAWRFLKQPFPDTPIDTDVVDILWFRLAPATGYWSLLVPIVLLAVAVALAIWCMRELRSEQKGDRYI